MLLTLAIGAERPPVIRNSINVVDDFVQPNGILFSPDEKKLYVIDSGISEGPGNPAHIRVFDVDIGAGSVRNGKVFADGFAPGLTDGMRCDVEGNVWCSMGWANPKEDGERCYSPQGELLGKIHVPETCANLTFGGVQRNRLYICARTSVYACYVNTQGALRPSPQPSPTRGEGDCPAFRSCRPPVERARRSLNREGSTSDKVAASWRAQRPSGELPRDPGTSLLPVVDPDAPRCYAARVRALLADRQHVSILRNLDPGQIHDTARFFHDRLEGA